MRSLDSHQILPPGVEALLRREHFPAWAISKFFHDPFPNAIHCAAIPGFLAS